MNAQIIMTFFIFCMGFYLMIFSETIIKSIIGLSVIQSALILLFVFFMTRTGNSVPIKNMEMGLSVDPLPQALMITAIVIGASITALTLMISIKIFHYYGTLNWHQIFERND